jgi:hypothetical protein
VTAASARGSTDLREAAELVRHDRTEREPVIDALWSVRA